MDIHKVKYIIKNAIWQWKGKILTEEMLRSKKTKIFMALSEYKIGPHKYINIPMPDWQICDLIRFKMGAVEWENQKSWKEENKCNMCKCGENMTTIYTY